MLRRLRRRARAFASTWESVGTTFDDDISRQADALARPTLILARPR